MDCFKINFGYGEVVLHHVVHMYGEEMRRTGLAVIHNVTHVCILYICSMYHLLPLLPLHIVHAHTVLQYFKNCHIVLYSYSGINNYFGDFCFSNFVFDIHLNY